MKRQPINHEQALRLYAEGNSSYKIAAMLKCNRGWVCTILKRNGVKSRRRADYPKWTSNLNAGKLATSVDGIIALYLEGHSSQELADKFNATSSGIRYFLKRQGISLRSRPPFKSGQEWNGKVARKISETAEREVIVRYLNGDTWKSLAEFSGLSIGGFRKLLQRNNVRPRGVSVQTRIALSAIGQGIEISDWSGFRKSRNGLERGGRRYFQWARAVKDRDGWVCQDCGKKCTPKAKNIQDRLEAHHIFPFADHVELRYEISNGISLCFFCHRKAENRQRKAA